MIPLVSGGFSNNLLFAINPDLYREEWRYEVGQVPTLERRKSENDEGH